MLLPLKVMVFDPVLFRVPDPLTTPLKVKSLLPPMLPPDAVIALPIVTPPLVAASVPEVSVMAPLPAAVPPAKARVLFIVPRFMLVPPL